MSLIPRQFFTEDIAVFLNQEGILAGLDKLDGRELWQVQHSLTEYPKLIDVVDINGRIYLITFEKDYAVNALNEYTGELKWMTWVDGYLSPESLVGMGDLLIVTDRKHYRTHIKAVDVKIGQTKWSWGMGGHGSGFDPIVSDKRLYVGGSPYPNVESFERNDKTIWPIKIYCLDMLTGNVLWETRHEYPYTDNHHRERPTMSTNHHPERGGIVCVDAGEGKTHMLNTLTGEVIWIVDTATLTRIQY